MYSQQRYRKTGFAIVAALVFGFAIYVAFPIWTAVAWGAILAVLVYPIHRRFASRMSQNAAAIATTVFTLFVVIVPLVLTGLAGAYELNTTLRSAKKGLDPQTNRELVQSIDAQIVPFFVRFGVPVPSYAQVYDSIAFSANLTLPATGDFIAATTPPTLRDSYFPGSRPSDLLRQAGQPFISAVPAIVAQVVKSALMSVFALVLLFFAVRDGHRLREPVLQLIPLPTEKGERVLTSIYDTFHATFYGVVLIAFLNGVILGGVYWLLGIPSPVLFGIVTIIVSFIPIAGPPVVWIPTAVWLAATGSWGKGIALALVGLLFIGLTVDKLYRSHLIGSRINIHPMVVMFSLIGGVFAFGPIGAFLGPVVVILTLAALNLLREITPKAA